MSSTSSNDNAKTLAAYDANLQAYIDDQPKEPSQPHQEFILRALKGLPTTAKILELGSGTGRDAQWIEDHGYKVLCTDASQAFVDYLRNQKLDTKYLDVLKDDFGGPFDLIYTSALLVHFDDAETDLIVRKSFDTLSPGGRFAIRTKEGDRKEWTNEKMGAPRYMHYFDKAALEQTLEQAGFKISSSYSYNGKSDYRGVPWMYLIASKLLKAKTTQ